MRLARAMKRKMEKKATTGDLRAVKSYLKAKKAVRHVTTREIVMEASVRRTAVVEIMATVVIAMHRSFGYGADRILRLRKKMRMQMECIKGRYVKLEEIEAIVEKELHWRFRIEKDSDLDLCQRTEYKTVRLMSAVLILSMHDEFGFGYKRAKKVYDELTAIWKAIHDGELSMESVFAEHDKICGRTVKMA